MSANEINEYIRQITNKYYSLLNPSPEETLIYSIQLSVLTFRLSQLEQNNV
jgi:hypothetical protein